MAKEGKRCDNRRQFVPCIGETWAQVGGFDTCSAMQTSSAYVEPPKLPSSDYSLVGDDNMPGCRDRRVSYKKKTKKRHVVTTQELLAQFRGYVVFV